MENDSIALQLEQARKNAKLSKKMKNQAVRSVILGSISIITPFFVPVYLFGWPFAIWGIVSAIQSNKLAKQLDLNRNRLALIGLISALLGLTMFVIVFWILNIQQVRFSIGD